MSLAKMEPNAGCPFVTPCRSLIFLVKVWTDGEYILQETQISVENTGIEASILIRCHLIGESLCVKCRGHIINDDHPKEVGPTSDRDEFVGVCLTIEANMSATMIIAIAPITQRVTALGKGPLFLLAWNSQRIDNTVDIPLVLR